ADDALTDLEGFRRDALDPAHEARAFVERYEGDVVRNLRRTRMHDRQGVDFAAAARFDPFQVLSARPRLGHPRIEDIGAARGASLDHEAALREMGAELLIRFGLRHR